MLTNKKWGYRSATCEHIKLKTRDIHNRKPAIILTMASLSYLFSERPLLSATSSQRLPLVWACLGYFVSGCLWPASVLGYLPSERLLLQPNSSLKLPAVVTLRLATCSTAQFAGAPLPSPAALPQSTNEPRTKSANVREACIAWTLGCWSGLPGITFSTCFLANLSTCQLLLRLCG